MRDTIREEVNKFLFDNKEEEYALFSSKLLPTIESNTVLGVRIPKLRKLASVISRKYSMDEIIEYIHSGHKYFEEIMITGFLIGNIKDINCVISETDYFVELIDNWSVCDSFCSSLKITKKYKEDMLKLIMKYVVSKQEYEFRFACVMLLTYYLENEHLMVVIDLLKQRRCEDYYAKMAVAWLYCSMYCVNRDNAFACIIEEKDPFIKDKAVSKMLDSYKVEFSDKEYLRNLRKVQNNV